MLLNSFFSSVLTKENTHITPTIEQHHFGTPWPLIDIEVSIDNVYDQLLLLKTRKLFDHDD